MHVHAYVLRLAEENSVFEKTIAELKVNHEAQLEQLAAELRQSSSNGNRALM